MVKAKQENLPGYKPTALEEAFRLLVDAKEQLEAAKENMVQKKEAMLTEMDNAGKDVIVKDGYMITKNIRSMKIDIKIKAL